MNFFKREKKLSQLIRAADPVGEASTTTLPFPTRRGWLLLPVAVLALVGIGVVMIIRPVALPVKKVALGKYMISQKKIDLTPRKIEVTPKKLSTSRRKTSIVIRKTEVSPKKSSVARRKVRIAPRKIVAAREKSEPLSQLLTSEIIVVAVRPITPDELKQELQAP